MKYRTSGVFLLIIGVLFIIVTINIKIISSRLITPASVESALSNILGTPVNIGTINFNFWRGIKITDIKIPLNNNKLTYNFAKIKAIRITYEKTKLLRGQFIIDRVVFYSPEINLHNNQIPEFRFNSNRTTPNPSIIIRNANVIFSDQVILKENTHIQIKNINLNFYPIEQGRYLSEGVFETNSLGSWEIHGEINADFSQVKLNMNSRDTDIGFSLSELLSKEYFHIWSYYQPQGKVDLNVNLKVNPNSPPNLIILMNCLKNEMRFEGFPYPLFDIEGQIEFTPNIITLKNLKGANGTTSVIASGLISGYEKPGGLDLTFKIKNLLLDNKLYAALGNEFKNVWDQLTPGGLTDAEVVVFKPIGALEETHYRTKIYCKKANAKPSFFLYPMENLTGEIEINDQHITIKNLISYHNKGELKVSGELNLTPNGNTKMIDVIVDAKNIELNDYTIKNAINKIIPGLDRAWNRAQPEGKINATVAIKQESGSPDIKIRSLIQCNNINTKVGSSALPLTNIYGQIEYNTHHEETQSTYLFLKNISGKLHKSILELNGVISNPTFDQSQTMTPSIITLNVKVSNLLVSHPELYGLLPMTIQDLLKRTDLSGSSDVTLSITNRELSLMPGTIAYQGEIKLFDCGFTGGINFSDITGALSFKGLHLTSLEAPSGFLAGSGNFSQLRVKNKKLSNISISFLSENNILSIYDLKGNAYNGAVNGYVIISLPRIDIHDSPQNKYSYQGKIEISAINIGDFNRDTSLSTREISGKLSGEFNFYGKDSSSSLLNGTGRAILTNAQIWEVPILLSVHNLFGLAKKSVFNEGEIRFTVSNDEIQVRRVALTSKDISIKGNGKVQLKDGRIDLQFDTKLLDTKIALIDNIKNFFVKGIYTVKVAGNLENPKAEGTLLPILFE